MRSMTLSRDHIYIFAAAIALVAVYLLVSTERTPTLEFQDRTFPQGFRDLVLPAAVSPINPAFGPSPGTRESGAHTPNLREICDALFHDPNSPSAGNRNGPVRMVMFFDYRCPYCKTLSGIMAAMPTENVRILFHEWAILSDSSVLAARAALAADRQGKYLPFHSRLMNSRLVPTLTYLDAIAAELGMDATRLHADMASESITLALQRTSALASTLGLIGTPALVIGRTIVQGEIARGQLERLIEVEMQAAPPKVC
jgi:hypothetical protein